MSVAADPDPDGLPPEGGSDPFPWRTAWALPLAVTFLAVTSVAVLGGLVGAGLVQSGLLPAPTVPGERIPAALFVGLAASAALSLVVVSAVLLRLHPGGIPWKTAAPVLGPSLAALAGVAVLNGMGSWALERTGEPYLGLPQIPDALSAGAVFLAAVLVAPVVEELFFREILLVRVFRRSPRPLAVVATSLVFGALHGQVGGVVLVATLAGMGAILAWLRLRTGSLGAAILVHAVNNAAALALAVPGVSP
jgi:uncharacterized protein